MSDNELIINVVGDVCLQNILQDNYTFSEEVKRVFSEGDLNLANLESPLTYSENQLKYRPSNLKGIPQMNDILNSFDIFSLANNHIMDFQEEGLCETMDFLTKNDKVFFGAGKNKKEALKSLVVERKNIKIAFIGFTRFSNASNTRMGAAPEDLRTVFSEIKKQKQAGCFVIVYPHWNYEWVDYPAPDERKKGHKLIDAGADIVVGAHPHIVQGFEIYKGKSIFYSLGNFVFKNTKYTKQIPQYGRSFILKIILSSSHNYRTEIFPVYSSNDGVEPMNGAERKSFESHFQSISEVLKDKKKSTKLFYETSMFIEKNNQFVFGELKKNGGVKAILSAYKKANMQDVKRKIYAFFHK